MSNLVKIAKIAPSASIVYQFLVFFSHCFQAIAEETGPLPHNWQQSSRGSALNLAMSTLCSQSGQKQPLIHLLVSADNLSHKRLVTVAPDVYFMREIFIANMSQLIMSMHWRDSESSSKYQICHPDSELKLM